MPRPTIPMPGSVKMAAAGGFLLIGLLLYFAVDIIELGLLVFVVLLFMALLARGHPLGWQGMRFIGFVTTLGSVPWLVFGVTVSSFLLPLVFMFGGFVIVNGLSSRAASLYFDLYCGHCRWTKVRARGFWFQRVECPKCARRWQPHGERVDLSAFD